jgi:hypothetical protein
MEERYKILRIQIEQTRNEMILLGQQYGLASPRTIQVSQKLDHLLNTLHYLESKLGSEYCTIQIKNRE